MAGFATSVGEGQGAAESQPTMTCEVSRSNGFHGGESSESVTNGVVPEATHLN